MTNRSPRLTGAQVLHALQRGGFQLVRIRGSHHYLRKPPDGGLVAVTVHGNRILPQKTLQSILRQASISAAELSDRL